MITALYETSICIGRFFMKKRIKIITVALIAITASAAYASCPIDSTMCVSDLMDINSSPTMHTDSILNNSNTNFPSNTYENTAPIKKEEVKRDYNTMHNDTGTYDANCQFGVCLPESKEMYFPNAR